jgi:predicted dehydrogenase
MSIHVGILGCASIARRSLIPAFLRHPAFSVSAVASRTPERAAEVAGTCGARSCSYDELVEASDVDFIYCPLPTGLHHEWVKRCLGAGKHVLCEKSLACTESEVSDLVSTAHRRELFLMESFQFQFHAQNLRVQRILNTGILGEIRQVVIRFGFPPFPDGSNNIRYSRALGGGALLDAGAYVVKAARFLSGSRLSVASASSWTKPSSEVDLGGTVSLVSSNGVVFHGAYGFSNFYQCGYEVWCEKGMVSTTRAFTARADFDAPVIISTAEGTTTETFRDDHFARLLDYVESTLANRSFTREYDECLEQSRVLKAVKEAGS